MGRKARQKSETPDKSTTKQDTASEPTLAPLGTGELPLALTIGAMLTVTFVILWFELTVNRVFDVPKAYALKIGGCGVFIVWLLHGFFGRGVPWKSVRLFIAPVSLFVLIVALSSAFSIDPWMSLAGVYERQFGLQGFLACTGLFVVTATGFRSRRGALLGIGFMVVIGGLLGGYSLLQAQGVDPFGFFKQPHNKVYSTLGNATFAGNAIALMLPVSAMLATTASGWTLLRKDCEGPAGNRWMAWAAGAIVIIALILAPSLLTAGDVTLSRGAKEFNFKVGAAIAVMLTIFLAAIGSWGLGSVRLESKSGRNLADAGLAGALVGMVALLVIGLWTTRTRGAWVGTAAAIGGGLLLLPRLFAYDTALKRRTQQLGIGLAVAGLVGLGGMLVLMPNHLFSRTVKSIPSAFNPDVKAHGKGQGTRRYLWVESPRVLTRHNETLHRIAIDEALRESTGAVDRVDVPEPSSPLRRVVAWLFGIGFETYRYAFQSHKSKALERLDPMTNHDNPHNNYLYVFTTTGLLGLLAYLWVLARLLLSAWRSFDPRKADEGSDEHPVVYRAIAFGVLTSFFSYAVYSIAGFDSVACSVLLFYLLGCASVLFQPNDDAPVRTIPTQVARQFAEWRGKQLPNAFEVPKAFGAPVAIIIVALLGHTMFSVNEIRKAEKAFVGDASRRPSFEQKINNIKSAIALNPQESYYRQTLGSTYTSAVRQYRSAARKLTAQGKADEARQYLERAAQYADSAEKSLYASLAHAWAPENIYISLFQLYYDGRQMKRAERALDLALLHSPHLAPVRANLAVIKLEHSKNYDGALVDALWVLDIDPSNPTALRTAGRAHFLKGELDQAKVFLDKAKAKSPKDPMIDQFLRELEAKSSTTG